MKTIRISTAGFNREFEELGEHAVRRRLGDFTPGKRPMAAGWTARPLNAQALAIERAEIRAEQAESRTKLAQARAERAEQRADKQLVVSILAIVATIIVAFVTPHIR